LNAKGCRVLRLSVSVVDESGKEGEEKLKKLCEGHKGTTYQKSL